MDQAKFHLKQRSQEENYHTDGKDVLPISSLAISRTKD
jgi:hypothetical protein